MNMCVEYCSIYMCEIACSGVLISGACVSSGVHAVELREWWGVVEFVRRGTARVGVNGECACAWWGVCLVGLGAVGYYDGVGYD